MAILVRASFQMREFEERFITLGLPYRVIGGPRFYERQEIRDALAYLRCRRQPADDLAFERIVNVPKRGLGDTTIRRCTTRPRAGVPLLRPPPLVETEELKPKRARARCASFSRFRPLAARCRHHAAHRARRADPRRAATPRCGRTTNRPTAPGRLENLKELVRSMGEFESLRGFLEHVSLVMDARQREADDAVSIMTLHSAKGLEFDTVFLPGWEEGLFPTSALDESGRAGLEEERRLAYVGITRAKKRRRRHIWFASEPPHPRPVAVGHPLALPRRTAGSSRRSGCATWVSRQRRSTRR
jgi:DNA helicase-2/ATP-dependent DNA helicase PcrA